MGALIDLLIRDPKRFDFLQGLRVARLALNSSQSSVTSLRVRHRPALHASNPDIESAAYSEGQLTLDTYAFGLLATHGPMPLRLIEEAVAKEIQAKDRALSDFLALLGEAQLQHFHAAWRLGRLEETAFSSAASASGTAISAAAGEADSRDAQKLLGLMPFLLNFARGPLALEQAVANIAKCQVRLHGLVGEWLPMASVDLQPLGRAALGRDAFIGRYVWQRAFRFHLHMYADNFQHYCDLLPGRGWLALNVQWVVHRMLSVGLKWDVVLHLKKKEVPPAQLGNLGQLGLTTWIGKLKTDACVKLRSASH